MLVTSRRSLITGVTVVIAAPALVKISSLMPLRGYDMDPWVLAFQHRDQFTHSWHTSDYNFPDRRIRNIKDWIAYNNHLIYAKMRKSEVKEHWLIKEGAKLKPYLQQEDFLHV